MLKDTIYDVLQELMNESEYRGFVGAGDVQRIEHVIAGFPTEPEYAEEQTCWLTGALAALAMVGPYTAQTAAEAIMAAMRGDDEVEYADNQIGHGLQYGEGN